MDHDDFGGGGKVNHQWEEAPRLRLSISPGGQTTPGERTEMFDTESARAVNPAQFPALAPAH